MIKLNTQLMFEGKIPTVQMLLHPQGTTKYVFVSRTIYVINTWFKFEDKIQNTSKVTMFTRNHTDDDADNNDKTTNNMSPKVRAGET